MDQPPTLHHAAASAHERSAVTDTRGWESDLVDLAALPLTAVEGLAPLPSDTRLLTEVLRSRGSIRGGGEPARAE